MAGTFTGKSIADGQVGIAQAAIYTVPGGVIGFVKQVYCFNTNAAVQTLDFWIKRSGGTSRKFHTVTLEQNESVELLDQGETIELSAGDAIEAQTTTASAVDYVVTGVEET